MFQQSVIIAYLQKHAELTKNSYQTIKYIKKCFVYVIYQNKGNLEVLFFQNLSAHIFNKHVISVVYGANKNPSTHKQPSLEPKFVYQFDKYFFKVYQNNALKIAPCGSC